MSKQQGREFRQRWEFLNAYVTEEIKNTPPEIKLQQLRTVFNSAHLFRRGERAKAVDEVRARWRLLKK